MTTIALTATEIAWDSQTTANHTRIDAGQSKVEVRQNVLIARAGDTISLDEFFVWQKKKFALKSKPKGDWHIIVIDHTGIYEYDSDRHSKSQFFVPGAIGSGYQHALTALDMGASAAQAVEQAANRCIYTSPPVHAMNYTALLTKPKRTTKRRRR